MKRTLISIGLLALAGIFGTAQAAGDAAAGKAKAVDCAGCHGANGQGTGGGPKLAGMTEAALVQAMQDYKTGKRSNPVMKTFADSLSDQDVANLAAYYASMK